MSVDVRADVLIGRTREEVAEIMFDPKCDRMWITGLSNAFPLTAGALEKGAKVEHVGDFLNRSFSAVILVTRDEPGKMVEFYTDEPFEMKKRYELKDADGGTLVSISIQSMGDVPFRMPASLLNKAVEDKIAFDLKRLKKHLENNSD